MEIPVGYKDRNRHHYGLIVDKFDEKTEVKEEDEVVEHVMMLMLVVIPEVLDQVK